MIDAPLREAIFRLHREGMAIRAIARQLSLSRNTVKNIIKDGAALPTSNRKDRVLVDTELLQTLYTNCDGYIQRVHEKLTEEYNVLITYSTLCRLLRREAISKVPQVRCDEKPDIPAQEMQHDTSPYTIRFGPERKLTKIQGSEIYLRYSKRRYLKFYRHFTRFTMKCFLHEAFMFWGYSAPECIIDNTNLARLRGTGKNAVMTAEMAEFSRKYGFKFVCHEINHANRKAGVEKAFSFVESNFFPGRTFMDLEDMNRQALQWATVRVENRRVGKTRVIPAQAFEHERAQLKRLAEHLPAPYRIHDRLTDQYGFISFMGNFYWVPGAGRDPVRVLEYAHRMQIYFNRQCLASYDLPPDGVNNQKFSPVGMPKPRFRPSNRKRPTVIEEKTLRGMDPVVHAYLDFALNPMGIARHGFIRKLFALHKKMTKSLFVQSIERALKYRITKLDVIERIAVLFMNQGSMEIPLLDVDGDFRQRQACQDGWLTETPDLSVYDPPKEDDDE